MIDTTEQVRKYKLRQKINGHIMTFKDNPNRVYLLSYPKCGRTWIRFMIGKYISIKYSKPENGILNYTRNTLEFGLNEFIYTHGGFSFKQNYLNDILNDINSTIFLLNRNIYDIVVSAYFHSKYRGELHYKSNLNKLFKGNLSEYIRDKNLGIKWILNWYKQVYSNNNIIELKYEKLLDSPLKSLKLILYKLSNEYVDDKILKEIIKYCKFENMQKLELENSIEGFSSKEILNKNDIRSLKTRKAIVGEYKNIMSDSDILYIKNQLNKLPDFIREKLYESL